MNLLIQQKYRNHPQGELAVHEGPELGKVHPHVPYKAWVTQRSLLCSPLLGHTLPWEGKKQAPLQRGCGTLQGEWSGLPEPRAKPLV